MVDILTLALTHGLMAITLWRLLGREDLGRDLGEAAGPPRPWQREPTASPGEDG